MTVQDIEITALSIVDGNSFCHFKQSKKINLHTKVQMSIRNPLINSEGFAFLLSLKL
jgi:hypothetical protein